MRGREREREIDNNFRSEDEKVKAEATEKEDRCDLYLVWTLTGILHIRPEH